MRVRIHGLTLPKSERTAEQCEDAIWPDWEIERECSRCRVAVSDGATDSMYSGLWARILAQAYCKGSLNVPSRLTKLQQSWREQVGNRPLPWYQEEKLRRGAFATIIGLTLRGTSWEAVAIGDSCLFQIRQDALISAFPLQRSDAFTTSPSLISSNPIWNDRVPDVTLRASGTVDSGDTFYLMTDALACWFLKSVEQDSAPWRTLDDLTHSERLSEFADWIGELREVQQIRNDDVALLRVDVV